MGRGHGHVTRIKFLGAQWCNADARVIKFCIHR